MPAAIDIAGQRDVRPDDCANQRCDCIVNHDGLRLGMGGLAVPFVGMLADRIGIERTLTVMAFMPLIAALFAAPLPAAKLGRTAARASDIGTAEGMDVAR